MLAGGLAAIGSWLPWATGFLSGIPGITGIDLTDGWMTFFAGLAFMVLGFLTFTGRPYPMWLAWAVLANWTAIAIINFLDIRETIEDAGVGSIGIGMWLLLLGVVIGIVGLVKGRGKSAA